jgi:hypothetical protein
MYEFGGESSLSGFTYGRYTYLGNSPSEIASNLINNPAIILSPIFSMNSLWYLIMLLLPVGFISILKPKILLIGLPIFLQNVLSNFSPQTTICWHYVSVLVFVIIIAAIYAFYDIYNKLNGNRRSAFIIIFILFSTSSFFYFSAASETYSHISKLNWEDPGNEQLNTIINNLPENATVFSSVKYGSYLFKIRNISFIKLDPFVPGYDYYLINRYDLGYFNEYTAFDQIMETGNYEITYISGQTPTVVIGLTNSSDKCIEAPSIFYKSKIGHAVVNCNSSIDRHTFYSMNSENKSGYLIYGPYIVLPQGKYNVTYSIRAENITDSDKKVTTLEISGLNRDTLKNSIDKKVDVYSMNLTSRQVTEITLPFEINATNTNCLMEFRVFQPSNADLYVSDITLSQIK